MRWSALASEPRRLSIPTTASAISASSRAVMSRSGLASASARERTLSAWITGEEATSMTGAARREIKEKTARRILDVQTLVYWI